ncbi:MAG: dynamin family protein [Gammaproteobacteria bacterium]|nr:dynamin family protein [Gammaproteobacteria bacterium]MDH5629725.1 dynamin family protein [Gammaproteobacteria bacterium]
MANELFNNINAFDQWKNDVNNLLVRLKIWLKRNQFFDQNFENQIDTFQDFLKQEYLTLAFVGEFSRGKTELINALFFSEYGQRILPSEAGRTTMCPTELFYDKKENRPYLRLLPIESRMKPTTLSEYRENPSHWREIPLLTGSALEMTQSLKMITETKKVGKDIAKKLGFDLTLLEHNDEKGQVEIPVWRHALVSFPHDLLIKGLRIIDTPGLNALGSEPELTLKVLPQVQAILFLLGADTGITASDMKIWQDYIQPLADENGLDTFVVLNKIDTLEDELSETASIENNLSKVIKNTCSQLNLNLNQVIPISAKKALIGKVRNDAQQLSKSKIDKLEHYLATNLLSHKKQLVVDSLFTHTENMISQAIHMATQKSEAMFLQRKQFEQITGDNTSKIEEMVEENKASMSKYEHQLVAIKPSQRLLERQSKILLDIVASETISKLVDQTIKQLVNSKTTVALFRHMNEFYDAVEKIISELNHEAELTNKMTISLYQKFNDDFGLNLLEPKYVPARRITNDLRNIIKHSKRLENNLITAFTEQSIAVSRFFSGTVTDLVSSFKQARKSLRIWTQNVLSPLSHQLKIQKSSISEYESELDALKQSRSFVGGKIKGLNRLIDDLEYEIENANNMKVELYRFKPEVSSSNVVSFTRSA